MRIKGGELKQAIDQKSLYFHYSYAADYRQCTIDHLWIESRHKPRDQTPLTLLNGSLKRGTRAYADLVGSASVDQSLRAGRRAPRNDPRARTDRSFANHCGRKRNTQAPRRTRSCHTTRSRRAKMAVRKPLM